MTSLIDEPELLVALTPDDLDRGPRLDLDTAVAREREGHSLTPTSPTPRPDRRRLQSAVLAMPVVILAALAWTHRNMFVDGYIYLHVVQNILAGHGPVFNVGQRVEAVTSPTWTWILAIAGLSTPFSLAWIAVVLGIVFTVAGCALALSASGRLVHRASPRSFLLPLGALLFIALPPVWSLASTGLETGLTFFWIASCLAILVRWSRTSCEVLPRTSLVILGMGYLIRPELLIDSLVFVSTVLLATSGRAMRRDRCRIIGWALAVPLLYEIFRMGYYGQLFTNTAVVKEAAMLSPGRGVHYFSDFVAPYWLFIPVGALLIGAYYPIAAALHHDCTQRRSHLALLALPTAGALNAIYIILIGGDYIHARLFMAPMFAFCAPVAAVPLVRRNVLALMVIPWAMVCALTFRTNDDSPWSSPSIVSINGHGSFAAPSAVATPATQNIIVHGRPGVYVQLAGPNSLQRLGGASTVHVSLPVIATSWIGPEPYELGSGVQVVDLLGLADPLTAHLQLDRRGEIAGHEKPLPTPWIAAELTRSGSSTSQLDSLQRQRPQDFTPLIPEVSGQKLTVETAWARAALQCPAIRDLRGAPSAPLTAATFLSNIYHAISRTTIRIPPDPEAAYHAFCGSGTPVQVSEFIGHGSK